MNSNIDELRIAVAREIMHQFTNRLVVRYDPQSEEQLQDELSDGAKLSVYAADCLMEALGLPKSSIVSIDQRDITILELSPRIQNGLRKKGINTIGELRRTTERQIRDIRNLGETSLREIQHRLRDLELSLGMDV